MKDMTKRVLILNTFTSPDIQQAIIVLRQGACTGEDSQTRIILEAEQVINRYLYGGEEEGAPSRLVWAVIMLTGLAVTALAVYGAVMLFHR